MLKQNAYSFYYSASDIATEKCKINTRTLKVNITNDRVGHLYNFSDFAWRKCEKSFGGTHFKKLFVLLW
jgi:hypothetical protein